MSRFGRSRMICMCMCPTDSSSNKFGCNGRTRSRRLSYKRKAVGYMGIDKSGSRQKRNSWCSDRPDKLSSRARPLQPESCLLSLRRWGLWDIVQWSRSFSWGIYFVRVRQFRRRRPEVLRFCPVAWKWSIWSLKRRVLGHKSSKLIGANQTSGILQWNFI